MKNSQIVFTLILATLLTACSRQKSVSGQEMPESREAKALLQGVWMDPESEEVSFSVKGDTIFYADAVSQPAYFKIVGDSIVFATGTKYFIEKQTEHLFWFRNQNGDLVKLEKSTDSTDVFVRDQPRILTYTHQVKTDSVVTYQGKNYHWYIAINPTKYKVMKRSYNDDGVEVENVYYDNIMHVSVYQGSQCIYSSDFRKQMYANRVPAGFLKDAILADMAYSSIDDTGLHFNATICIPDGASCYLVDTTVGYNGRMTMKTIEY